MCTQNSMYDGRGFVIAMFGVVLAATILSFWATSSWENYNEFVSGNLNSYDLMITLEGKIHSVVDFFF